MDQPGIQYARAPGGGAVAYRVMGDGFPIIQMPPIPFAHLRDEWEDLACRRFHERVGQGARLVRYDSRPPGASGRGAAYLSTDRHVRSLDTLAESLRFEHFSLFGLCGSAAAAITYAARNPGRVRSLALWCPFVLPARPARGVHGAGAAGAVGQTATVDGFARLEDEPELSSLLGEVLAPTLVIQPRGAAGPLFEEVLELVARMPNASLAIIDGTSLLPYMDSAEEVVRLVRDQAGLPYFSVGRPASS